jgi:hypothetical protein
MPPDLPPEVIEERISTNSRAGLGPNDLVRPALGSGTRVITSSKMLSIDGCANHAQSSIGHKLRALMLPVYRTLVTICGVSIIGAPEGQKKNAIQPNAENHTQSSIMINFKLDTTHCKNQQIANTIVQNFNK